MFLLVTAKFIYLITYYVLMLEWEEIEEVLRKRLEEKKEKPQRYPFFKFTNENPIICGEVVSIRNIGKTGENTVYDVRAKDGTIYTIGTYANLTRQMKEMNIKVGDYVMIRYEGEGKEGKYGKKIKLFSCSKIGKEEIEEIMKLKEKEKEVEKYV